MKNKKTVGRPNKWKPDTQLKRFHRFLPLQAMPEILKKIDIICKTYENEK